MVQCGSGRPDGLPGGADPARVRSWLAAPRAGRRPGPPGIGAAAAGRAAGTAGSRRPAAAGPRSGRRPKPSPVASRVCSRTASDDDHAAGDGLGGAGQVVQREDVAERGEDQHAEDGADDGAAAADEQRAADDDGGDGVQLVERAVGGAAGRRPRHQHDRGDAAGDAGQDVELHGVPLHPDAGQPGGLGVAADGEGAPAERRAVEQHPAGDGDQREDDHQRRDAEHVAGEEGEEVAVLDDLGAPVGDDLGQAAGGGEHRQGRDEGDELAVGDDHAVDQPGAGADQRAR